MRVRSTSYYLAPALLALGALLVAANWYLKPERAGAWAGAAALLSVVAGVWTWLTLAPPRSSSEDARRRTVESVAGGIVSAGGLLVAALGLKLAASLGMMGDADVARRSSMAFLGLFLAFLGNSMPKTLTPLSALRCDAAKVQAMQRLSGWTWVLAGLAYALAWLTLPLELAKPVSTALIVGAMAVVVTQLVRLLRSRHRAA